MLDLSDTLTLLGIGCQAASILLANGELFLSWKQYYEKVILKKGSFKQEWKWWRKRQLIYIIPLSIGMILQIFGILTRPHVPAPQNPLSP